MTDRGKWQGALSHKLDVEHEQSEYSLHLIAQGLADI